MKACFMGLGYIGLPSAIVAADNGIEVTGVDINPASTEKAINFYRQFVQRELHRSPAKYIATRVMQGHNDADFLIVEPNIESHKVFKLTDYREAYEKADIVAFLVAHDPFKTLPWREDTIILDFCGIFKKN